MFLFNFIKFKFKFTFFLNVLLLLLCNFNIYFESITFINCKSIETVELLKRNSSFDFELLYPSLSKYRLIKNGPNTNTYISNINVNNNNNNNDNNVNKNFKSSEKDEIFYTRKSFYTTNTSTTTTTTTQVSSLNSVLPGSLTSHYQVITICNTLPSILKCQNRQHYLILHRVIYGISEYKSQNECLLKTKCMQSDEKDEFNCTGSNICVFYPVDKYLRGCQSVKSNLTQIHIACVNLVHLKKYYLQKNRKFDEKLLESKQNETNNNPSNSNANKNQLNSTVINTSTSKINKTNDNRFTSFETSNPNHNSIVITISILCSFLAIVLISFIYYKIKMKQILTESKFSVSPPATTSQNINSSLNSNSGIYMANTSQLSFGSLPNMPPPPPGFEGSKNRELNRIENNSSQSLNYQNCPINEIRVNQTCDSVENKNSFSYIKDRFRKNYDLFQKNLDKKLINLHEFLHTYVYDKNFKGKLESVSVKNQIYKSSENTPGVILQDSQQKNSPKPVTRIQNKSTVSKSSKDQDIYVNSEMSNLNLTNPINDTQNSQNVNGDEIYSKQDTKSNHSLSSKWMDRINTSKNNIEPNKDTNKSTKSKSNQTDYYQINNKVFPDQSSNSNKTLSQIEAQNNLNLLKKSSINLTKNKINIHEMIQKVKNQSSENESTLEGDNNNYEERPKRTKLASLYTNTLEASSSSSIESDDTDVSDTFSASSINSTDMNGYYQRSSNAGISFTYMLYDIPEENDEETQCENGNVAISHNDGTLRI